ncbi:MAG: LamG domain-containing protein, partial [Candidatus Puniceispirillales bacterium]
VYSTPNGSGSLEVSDFAFTISGGTATLASATPSSISSSGNTYTLGINLSGTSDGTETLTLNPVDDGVYDTDGNESTTSQSNNSVTLNDITPASITGITLAADNSTVSVTFSEAVYNATGGSGALEVSDFAFSISGGTATLASATPSSISASGNTYTLGINLTGTADGNELFKLNPYNASSIYDGNNNASYSTQSNNTVSLNAIVTNYVLSLNGSNEAAYVGDNSAFESTDYSIQLWVDPASLPSSGNQEWFVNKNKVYRIGLNNNSGTTKIIAEHRSGGSYERLEGTTLSNANGGWYHVVFTFDDGDNDLKLYVNGSLVADNNNYSGSTGNQSSSFSIGRRHDNSTGYLDGKIDEVAYWDEELSASAISALYNSGNTLSASTNSGSYQSSGDLVIYYEFQQNLNDSEGSFNLSNTGINSSNYGLETIQ